MDRDDLWRVTPESLRAYLDRSAAWHEAASLTNNAGQYYELADAKDAVLVPASARFADYALRMAENLTVLADHEQRDPTHVLDDLLARNDDVVRVRIVTSARDNTLSLEAGEILLAESRNLISAAAYVAAHGDQNYSTKPSDVVQTYLRSVRFGHTEQGSFVVSIYSPVFVNPPDEPQVRAEKTLPRRAMQTLVSALANARHDALAPASGWAERLKIQVGKGVLGGKHLFNAHICSALLALIGLAGGVTLSVNWALAYPPPQRNYGVRFDSQDGLRMEQTKRTLERGKASAGHELPR